MRTILFILIASTFIFFLSCSEDESPTEGGGTTLSGTVLIKSTQQPASGALVFLGQQLETTTDGSGNFKFSDVRTLKQALRIEKSDYAVFVEDVTPEEGENTMDVELETIVEFCNRVTSVEYQGRTYNTILIDKQCWFKENLNVGNRIDFPAEQTNNPAVEKYCINNRNANCDKWGGIYTWNEAMMYVSAHTNQGICPNGWYIPTIEDFKTLGAFVEENGNALKSEGVGDEEGIGTNESGWTALISGITFRDFAGEGPLQFATGFPRWWSSTESGDETGTNFGLNGGLPNTYYEMFKKDHALSIRCIKE